MLSNALMQPLPCVFQECCPILIFKIKILRNCLSIASSVSLQGHKYQIMWRGFLTPMLQNVLMWKRGDAICNIKVLTQ